nr:uncharacterized mitochondrial protein AtMg00810-like [Tanacetum cinerariifolium]
MVKRFEMSMIGEMKFFLGHQVNQFSNGIFINQVKYILDILKRFGMENCDTVPNPMVKQAKLKLDLVGKPVDHIDYRSMIGSLMYVTSNKPDIMFATFMCARYQANPNKHHVSSVKKIFRYLKGTINLGLWYPKDSSFDLTAYSDADHAGCHLDRKSTSGSVQFLGDKLVCWSSKKQNCESISTTESEYVVANPNEHHVSAVKRIFRYLKGTINLGLWYLKDSGFDLTAYSEADHAGCHLYRKSTSGSV